MDSSGFAIAEGEAHEFVLASAIDIVLVFERSGERALAIEDAGFGVIGELEFEDLVNDALADGGIFDGEDDFDSSEEIAGHPIGASEVEGGIAGVFEVENPRVFEVATDDRADGDIRTDFGDSWSETADPADDEIDFDAGIGGEVEGFDEVLIDEGIHLGDDARGNP